MTASPEVPEVLFVCVHNAGRSQMAAALLDRHAQGQVLDPGKRYLDWELTDPAGKTAEEIRPIRDDIDARVQALLAELTAPAPAATPTP